jgi:hypothetical protein
MDEILILDEGNGVIVSVIASWNKFAIYTRFAGTDVYSNRTYDSGSLAISDARTIFYLLNGLNQLMDGPVLGAMVMSNRVTE